MISSFGVLSGNGNVQLLAVSSVVNFDAKCSERTSAFSMFDNAVIVAIGLHKYKKELEVVLETEKIDVCSTAETHFTNESYFKIKNFEIYHTIHPVNCARGGSAVIVRSSIKHHEDVETSSDMFQTTSVIIETDNFPLCLTSLYSPPRHSIKTEDYKDLFNLTGEKFIIGGDFTGHSAS